MRPTTIGFVLFEAYHQRKNIGSSRIRGRWVIDALNQFENVFAEEFVQGKQYDVIVYQKAYWKEMARSFKGIQILDICDPDWLDGVEIVSFCKLMNAVVVPTSALGNDINNFSKTPVFVIPDRVDMSCLPPPKDHTGKGRAKYALWFGYSSNIEVLYPALDSVRSLGLTLVVVSDGHLNTRECHVINIPWDVETCNTEYQKADFALLPNKTVGRFRYKSDNKTVLAWSLGLPVAKTEAEMLRFLSEDERKIESEKRLEEVRTSYDIRRSAEELLALIQGIKKGY